MDIMSTSLDGRLQAEVAPFWDTEKEEEQHNARRSRKAVLSRTSRTSEVLDCAQHRLA